MNNAIECEGLSRRFFRSEAIRELYLQVPAGSIFGLLGPNGAGKTTTMQVALNILRPSGGCARVLGTDSQRLRPADYARIGYVSENQELPEWMTVRELLDYLAPFYPTWDTPFARGLTRRLDLPADRRIGSLSRGMRVKAALVSVLAFRPRLLILDEPLSGLDALVRDEVIEGILELTGEQEWTVFLSSHEIAEIENLIDQVAFLSGGRLRFRQELSELRGRFRAVEVIGAPPELPAPWPATWLGPESAGSVLRFVDARYIEGETEQALRGWFPGASSISAQPMALRSIFVALAKAEREEVRQ